MPDDVDDELDDDDLDDEDLDDEDDAAPGLLDCPACGEPVSSSARSCPHCGHPLPRRSRRERATIGLVVAAVAAVVAVLIVVVLRASPPSGPSTTSAGDSGTPIAGAGGLTVGQLDASVLAQMTEASPRGFGVSSATTVECTAPSSWTDGAKFSCFPYDASHNGLGQYSGTVLPDANGTPDWNGTFVPYANGTTGATGATGVS